MKYIAEFVRLIGELVMKADIALIAVTGYLAYRGCSIRFLVSLALAWTTVKWLGEYYFGPLEEEIPDE